MSRASVGPRAATILALITGVTLATAVAALADVPTTAPMLTSPADGAVLTQPTVTVSADSAAAQVRFAVSGQQGDPDYDKMVPVVGGSASAQFSLVGLAGATSIVAFDCDDLGACNTVDSDSVPVTIELPDPVITSPADGSVVQSTVTVSVDAPAPAVQFLVDGAEVSVDTSEPIQQQLSLAGMSQGAHTILVRQCNADATICEGGTASLRVIRDTVGPRWSDLSASNKTVFPAKDHFKDSTVLSARVSERSLGTRVEIRKAGGPLVRSISLGRVGPGRVRATWNGRKDSGDVAPEGRYLYRFVGSDNHGNVGKSSDKPLHVSDRQLVTKTITRTVSAKRSFVVDGSGTCSGVFRLDYPQSRYGWPGGAGYYSRSRCNGSRSDDTAIALHRVSVPKAMRYGRLRIDTYGGGAFRHAGPGVILYVLSDDTAGAGRVTGASLGWHRGPSADADRYVKNGKISWVFGTVSGNWFDVKEYRVSLRIVVLR